MGVNPPPPVNLKMNPWTFLPNDCLDRLKNCYVPLSYVTQEDVDKYFGSIPDGYYWCSRIEWKNEIIRSIINRYRDEQYEIEKQQTKEEHKEIKLSKYEKLCEKYLEIE